MGTDKQEEEDDGRVIADMSGIETPSLFAPFSGRKKKDGRRSSEGQKRPAVGRFLPESKRTFLVCDGSAQGGASHRTCLSCRTGGGDPFAVVALESSVS